MNMTLGFIPNPQLLFFRLGPGAIRNPELAKKDICKK
jgi:hypothetical protein